MNRKRSLCPPTATAASELDALREALASPGTTGIDVAKVAAIRAAIAKGELSIDPAKIADGVLATTREWLAAQAKS